MNKQGFTVPQMIMVACGGILFLVVAAIIYQTSIRNIQSSPSKNEKIDPEVIDTNPTLENDHEEDYSSLESKVKDAMQKYIDKNSYNSEEVFITMTTEELIQTGILSKLTDPNDENNICHGYGYYQVSSNEYRGYIRCPGNYATEGYNPEFE